MIVGDDIDASGGIGSFGIVARRIVGRKGIGRGREAARMEVVAQIMARDAVQALGIENVLGRETLRRLEPLPDGGLADAEGATESRLRLGARDEQFERFEGSKRINHGCEI